MLQANLSDKVNFLSHWRDLGPKGYNPGLFLQDPTHAHNNLDYPRWRPRFYSGHLLLNQIQATVPWVSVLYTAFTDIPFFFFSIQVLNRKCVWSRPKCGKDQKRDLLVKGPIRVKFAHETTAPEITAFPQIRGITYYTLNPVIFVRNNASWLFRKWQKRVAFCFCPGSVELAIFTMCLEAPFCNKESENTTVNNHSK